MSVSLLIAKNGRRDVRASGFVYAHAVGGRDKVRDSGKTLDGTEWRPYRHTGWQARRPE